MEKRKVCRPFPAVSRSPARATPHCAPPAASGRLDALLGARSAVKGRAVRIAGPAFSRGLLGWGVGVGVARAWTQTSKNLRDDVDGGFASIVGCGGAQQPFP